MKETVINISNMSKSYGSVKIFNNLNFSCSEQKIIGITGPNGSGKSVFFKLVSGLIRPDSGEVVVFGENLTKQKKIATHLGALIEEPGFIPNYSGFDNLKFLAVINNKINNEEILSVLKKVGLEEVQYKKVKTYSLGMKKKLGIAQAIMEKPKLLLLDEPMNALDKNSVSIMREVFKDLANNGTTIILASHNDNDITYLCDEIYVIEDRKISKL